MHTTEAQERLYCGSDLHGNNVFLTLCNGQGERILERRVKANLPAVNAALDPYWERIEAVAVESTYNWYWLVDGLRSQGREVRLANPARMAQYEGLKVGDDASDAGWVAEQLRLGILPESYVYPPEVRPMRLAFRKVRGGRQLPGSRYPVKKHARADSVLWWTEPLPAGRVVCLFRSFRCRLKGH